jgi:hypothetical protein
VSPTLELEFAHNRLLLRVTSLLIDQLDWSTSSSPRRSSTVVVRSHAFLDIQAMPDVGRTVRATDDVDEKATFRHRRRDAYSARFACSLACHERTVLSEAHLGNRRALRLTSFAQDIRLAAPQLFWPATSERSESNGGGGNCTRVSDSTSGFAAGYLRPTRMPVVAVCLHSGGTTGSCRELALPDAFGQGRHP